MVIEYLGNTGYVQGRELNAYLVGMDDNILSLQEKNKVVLIGAGEDGYVAKKALNDNGVVVWKFADNNTKLSNRFIDGTEIESLDDLLKDEDIYFVISVNAGNIGGVRIQLMAHNIKKYSVFIRAISHSFINENNAVHELFMDGINKICFENETMESALPQAGYSSGRDCSVLGNVNWLLKSSEWSYYGFGWISELFDTSKELKIFEVGPGYGLMSYILLRMYPKSSMHWVVFGEKQTQLRNEGYERGLKKVQSEFQDRISFCFGKIEIDTELLTDKYDLIIMTEVFEHFALNPIDTMTRFRKLLNPGGKMFMTTPNWGHLPTFRTWEELRTIEETGIDRYNELLQCGHVYQYNKDELEDVFNRAGWKVEKYAVSDSNNHNYLISSRDDEG